MAARRPRKVVVKFTPDELEHKHKDVYAMRIRGLGLTAYGTDKADAQLALENLFHSFITGHREQGTLENVLNLAKADWYWEDEYDSDDVPVKHTEPRSRANVQHMEAPEPNWSSSQATTRERIPALAA